MSIALTETTVSPFVYTPKIVKKTAKYKAAVLAGAKTTNEIITAFNAANQCDIHPTNVGQAAVRLGQTKYNGDLYHPAAVNLITEDLLRLLKRRQSFEKPTQENTA